MIDVRIEDLKARKKPQRCLGDDPDNDVYWDQYGCKFCGCRYHCSQCGGGTGMMAHYIKYASFVGFWCEVAEG